MTERRQPRMSLNQLTEYLIASPGQRKRIIEQQKHPNDFQVIYYHNAQDAIQRFIAGGMSKEELLLGAIDDLYSRSAGNQYEHDKNISNAQAIQSFFEFYQNIDLVGLKAVAAPDDQPKFHIGSLDISVRPEIILKGNDRHSGLVIGALKLYFRNHKKAHLNEDSAIYPSAILYKYLEKENPDRKPLNKACIMADVFGQNFYTTPQSHKRILAEVKVACEEIAIWWDHV
jgi:hypothetical protein